MIRMHQSRFVLLVLSMALMLGMASIPTTAFEGILSAGLMIHNGDARGYLYSHVMMGEVFMLGLEFNPREYSLAALLGRRSGLYTKVGWESDTSIVPKYADVGAWGRTFLTQTSSLAGFIGLSRISASGKYDLKLAAEMVAPISDYVYVIGGAETTVISNPGSTKGWLGVGLAF
jgi:hypothetical protein